MSSETATRDATADAETDTRTSLRRSIHAAVTAFAGNRDRIVEGAGAVAVLAIGLQTGLRIVHNLPYEPVAVSPPVRALTTVGTPIALALAAVATALATRRPTARVGLLFVAAFLPLSLFSPAATLPAVAGVIGGGTLAVVGTLGRPTNYLAFRRTAIGVAFTAGVAVSLAGSVGLLSGGSRGLGAILTLGALAAVGLLAEGDRVGLVAGALAFLGIAAAGATSPYVAGSVLIVGFSVVGVPNLLVALAAGGGVAAVATGLHRRDVGLAAGAGLLGLAGVPVTLPRAAAVLLGATLVLVGHANLTDAPDARAEVTP